MFRKSPSSLNSAICFTLARMLRGVSHTEFIRAQDGRIYFLETSARVGGAYIVDVVEASFDRAEDLLEEAERTDYAAIVLCVDGASSALARLVGSLAQVFVLTPIVVIHTKIERWEVRAALAAGAAGVVLHDSLDTTLAPCLQAVRAGQTCVPRGYWRQIDPPALSSTDAH